MPATGPDPFNHAIHTANIWLADASAAFGTRDRHYTHRALRAWLHTLRDRLTVEAAAKFAAQLPELLRGIFFDGWEPNKVPVKYGVDEYTRRFAAEAGIPPVQVPIAAATITQTVGDHMSPGQLDQALAELPVDLRTTITGTTETVRVPVASATRSPAATDRVDRLEDQINSLTEAVRALARGLEDGRLTGIDEGQVTRAARLADEILIAAGSRS